MKEDGAKSLFNKHWEMNCSS